MPDVHAICRAHLTAAAHEAGPNVSLDVVGRAMLGEIVAVWREQRTLADIKDELVATSDNLDPDEEYAFMRP
jgi:hypothetical protein